MDFFRYVKTFSMSMSELITLIILLHSGFYTSGKNTPTVIVYGSTGAGVISAIAASRSGATVILLEPRQHIGGMVSGGLQHTDVGIKNATKVIGGTTLEFFERVEKQYPGRPVDPDYPPGHSPPGWLFESHVAEEVMLTMLQEANVTIIRNVAGIESVIKEGTIVKSVITVEVGVQNDMMQPHTRNYTSTVFVDASYEGDLLAMAGTNMTWGRESTAQYGEKGAGRQPGTPVARHHISPYWDSTVPESQLELLPHVNDAIPVGLGDADKWMEVYTFRLCMTNHPTQKAPITRPPMYNASEWELWRRMYNLTKPTSLSKAGLNCLGPIPNNYSGCTASYFDDSHEKVPMNAQCKKCDMIGNLLNPSTDMVNGAWEYPNAKLQKRNDIWNAHINYAWGLLWFWGTDPTMAETIRNSLCTSNTSINSEQNTCPDQSFGLCSDEYLDTSPKHWPHQLYVREAKRLVGDWVFTESTPTKYFLNRSIGMGAYSFDCHEVSRIIHREGQPTDHYVVQEGRVNLPSSGTAQPPFRIPYDALLPKKSELTNVLGAIASSSSHIRYNALRMEPTWMIMGHAAGVAAAMAAGIGTNAGSVQDIDINTLQKRLRLQNQIIALP